MTATASSSVQLKLTCENSLTWYQSTTTGARGFCLECGASIFWQGPDESYMAIPAGALDDSTGLQISAHIFVADEAPYYKIADGAPQHLLSGHRVPLHGA